MNPPFWLPSVSVGSELLKFDPPTFLGIKFGISVPAGYEEAVVLTVGMGL